MLYVKCSLMILLIIFFSLYLIEVAPEDDCVAGRGLDNERQGFAYSPSPYWAQVKGRRRRNTLIQLNPYSTFDSDACHIAARQAISRSHHLDGHNGRAGSLRISKVESKGI
jgi:hypothetical protein